MLIAISGPQGCGKSSTIQSLVERYGYNAIERKTSRSILKDWDTSLDQIYSNSDKVIQYQEELLLRKQNDEMAAIEDCSTIWITERSYLDLFTYAVGNVGNQNRCNDWLNSYYQRCLTLHNKLTLAILLTRIPTIDINDGVRPCNTYYADMVDRYMQHLYHSRQLKTGVQLDLTDPVERIDTIHGLIEMHKRLQLNAK